MILTDNSKTQIQMVTLKLVFYHYFIQAFSSLELETCYQSYTTLKSFNTVANATEL